jgi:rhodanese-related sulfurtransferase
MKTATTLVTMMAIGILGGCAHPQRAGSITQQRAKNSGGQLSMSAVNESTTKAPQTLPAATNITVRHDVTIEEIRKHQKDNTAIIVDARSAEQYELNHLKGAINLPAGQRDANIARLSAEVAPDQLIIIYCTSSMCEAGDMVYEYLAEAGYTNMRVYKPGWERLAVALVDRMRR